MAKKNETAVLEPVQEIKIFTATYQQSYKGNDWPILVEFTNRIVTDAPVQQDHLNGFYEVIGWRGDSMACYQFQGEVVNCRHRRKEFDRWLETQMK